MNVQFVDNWLHCYLYSNSSIVQGNVFLGQIDTADEKIHGLDAKALYEEDDSDTIHVRGNRLF